MVGDRSTEHRTFQYGRKTIKYSLFFSDRKTLEIAVHPDGLVILKAPQNSDIKLIEIKLQKRARWILKQLAYFEQFQPRTPERSYVNGETHLYLGKQYRLKLALGEGNSVKLSGGYFIVTSPDLSEPEFVKQMLEKWYVEKAQMHFKNSLERCWLMFAYHELQKPQLVIKKMQRRWGSLSSSGTLTLNTDLIRAPKECIDYVVIHELCHLKHPDHSSEFYRLLDSIIPDWERIKHKLELKMS